MHRVQRCGLLLLLFRSLCVSVRWILPSAVLKRMNRSRHRLVCGLGWPKEPCIKWDPASPNRRGNFGGYPPLKYIRLCKQQTLQQVGESVASEWTRGGGVTSAGTMWSFVIILWPLVCIMTIVIVCDGADVTNLLGSTGDTGLRGGPGVIGITGASGNN